MVMVVVMWVFKGEVKAIHHSVEKPGPGIIPVYVIPASARD
jgi:hypothetical protein